MTQSEYSHVTNYYSHDLDAECEVVVKFDFEPYEPGDRETPPVDERIIVNSIEPFGDASGELTEAIWETDHDEYALENLEELMEVVNG